MKNLSISILFLSLLSFSFNSLGQKMLPSDLKEKTLLILKWEEKDPKKVNKYDYNHFVKYNKKYDYKPPYVNYCKRYIKIANKNVADYNKVLEEELKNYPYKYKIVTEAELDSLYSDKSKYPYVLTKFYIENHVRWHDIGLSPTSHQHDAVSFVIRLFIYDRSSETEYNMFPKGKLTKIKNRYNTTYKTFIETIKKN